MESYSSVGAHTELFAIYIIVYGLGSRAHFPPRLTEEFQPSIQKLHIFEMPSNRVIHLLPEQGLNSWVFSECIYPQALY